MHAFASASAAGVDGGESLTGGVLPCLRDKRRTARGTVLTVGGAARVSVRRHMD